MPQLVKKVPKFYGTPKVHYRIHKRPPPVSILRQKNPVHVLSFSFGKIDCVIILPSTLQFFPQWVVSFRFPDESPLRVSLLPINATSSAHLHNRFDHRNKMYLLMIRPTEDKAAPSVVISSLLLLPSSRP